MNDITLPRLMCGLENPKHTIGELRYVIKLPQITNYLSS